MTDTKQKLFAKPYTKQKQGIPMESKSQIKRIEAQREGDIPEEGKKYTIISRPWDMSYLEIKEDSEGEWIYKGKE